MAANPRVRPASTSVPQRRAPGRERRSPAREHTAAAACQDGRPETQPLLVMRGSKDYDGTLRLLAGRADPPIRSLELRLEDGSTETIPLGDRFFLHDIDEGKKRSL